MVLCSYAKDKVCQPIYLARGRSLHEAGGKAEIGAQVDSLPMTAYRLKKKATQLVPVETAWKGLLSIYISYAGLGTLQCESQGNCQKKTCNVPLSAGQNPKNTEVAEVSSSHSTIQYHEKPTRSREF